MRRYKHVEEQIEEFQSLIGILVDFQLGRVGAKKLVDVSIPDRDFSGFPGLLSGRLAVFGFQGTFPRTSLILSS